MGPGRGCGEAGQPFTPARGCAARARPRRLRAAPDRTPPTPGWAVPPFGPAAPLRLLSAAAAGRPPRSSPALSGTAPRPAHRQPPPDLLLPTWPPPPPALGSFRRQQPETSEAAWNGRAACLVSRPPTTGEFRKHRRRQPPGTRAPPRSRRPSFGSVFGNPRSDPGALATPTGLPPPTSAGSRQFPETPEAVPRAETRPRPRPAPQPTTAVVGHFRQHPRPDESRVIPSSGTESNASLLSVSFRVFSNLERGAWNSCACYDLTK